MLQLRRNSVWEMGMESVWLRCCGPASVEMLLSRAGSEEVVGVAADALQWRSIPILLWWRLVGPNVSDELLEEELGPLLHLTCCLAKFPVCCFRRTAT